MDANGTYEKTEMKNDTSKVFSFLTFNQVKMENESYWFYLLHAWNKANCPCIETRHFGNKFSKATRMTRVLVSNWYYFLDIQPTYEIVWMKMWLKEIFDCLVQRLGCLPSLIIIVVAFKIFIVIICLMILRLVTQHTILIFENWQDWITRV